MSETPNMLLELPEVSETIGPTWASMLNTALEAIDEHTHATDSGVKITPAGMNINATLEINSQDITEVNSLSLDTRASAPSTLRALYSKSGDLYYKNTSGTEVQVTNAGTIAGTPGSITNLGDGGSSAVFSDLNEDFTWYFTGTRLAAMNMGDIRLYPFDGSAAYTNFVTLKSPTSLASSYSITMPGTAPAQSGVWSVNTSGVIQNGLHDGSAANPSIYFNGDTDLGLYRVGANQLGVIGQLQSPVGSAGTPSYSFVGDANTGMYSTGADAIGWSVNGSNMAIMNGSLFVLNSPHLSVPDGSVGNPSIQFNTDPDTGFYKTDLGYVSLAANGVLSAQIGTAGLYLPLGSDTTPSFSFMSDPNTGFYQAGADHIGAATGGTCTTVFNSTGLSTDAGSTFIKWKVYTGSLAAGASTTLTPGGTVRGAIGWSSNNGSSSYVAIENWTADSANAGITFEGSAATSTVVNLKNADTNSTNTYNVVVYYL